MSGLHRIGVQPPSEPTKKTALRISRCSGLRRCRSSARRFRSLAKGHWRKIQAFHSSGTLSSRSRWLKRKGVLMGGAALVILGCAALLFSGPSEPRDEAQGRIDSAIQARQLVIGMTMREAEAAWGAPYGRRMTIDALGAHEQWLYERNGKVAYLYFDEGKLKGYQRQK